MLRTIRRIPRRILQAKFWAWAFWWCITWTCLIAYRTIWEVIGESDLTTVQRLPFEIIGVICALIGLRIYATKVHEQAVDREQAAQVQKQAQAIATTYRIPHYRHAAHERLAQKGDA